MLKNFIGYTSCPGLSPVILVQFTLEMGTEAENFQKNTEIPYCLRFKVIKSHRC